MKKLIFLALLACAMLTILCSCGECTHNFSSPTCISPSICTLCGETSGTTIPHTYSRATCTTPQTCLDCGTTKGEALGHQAMPATCKKPSVCVVCNEQVAGVAAHSFTLPSCKETSYCSVCFVVNPVQGTHRFSDASCDAPKTCLDCGITEGTALEHIWTGDTCQTKKRCSLCGLLGEMNEHNWIGASCDSAAYCSKCNESKGEALGHSFVGTTCLEPSVCSVCGKTTTENPPHRWIFTGCTSLRYCAYCTIKEAEPPGHDIVEASCENATYCKNCSYSNGDSPLGHNWAQATCTRPTTCVRCKKTEGTTLDHTWKFIEKIEPKCNEGAEVYRCVCGEERRTVLYPVYSYHICDTNGVCSICNTRYDVSKMKLMSINVSTSFQVLNQGTFLTTETTTKIYKTITAEDLGMPVVELNGDLSLVTQNGYIRIPFVFDNGEKLIECQADVKIQGASSAGYPKKNYSIKLFDAEGGKNKVKIQDGWGKQFKYCLKANWVDYSQARNVVSGQLYGDVIDARNVVDELTNLPSGGAIDGFPMVLFSNGQFVGLYTFNIPKDKWMFNMKDSDDKNQAIVMATTWNDEVAMRKELSYNPNGNWTGSSGWELEYASNEDSLIDNNANWVAESLNNLVKFVMNNDGEDFKNGIHDYVDVDRCIDSMLHTFFICADDNISKNILWATYDGVHWFSSVYDMDGTWGLQWNGNLTFKDANTHLINVLESHNNSRYNLLWEKLYLNFYDEIAERYWELRGSVYTMEHITERFEAFFDQIPLLVRTAERAKWTNVPSQDSNTLAQILDYAQKRIEKMDKILKLND